MTWLWVMPGGALGGVAREAHLAGAKVLRGPMGFGSGLATLEKAQAPQYGADVKHAPA
jgi:hypothetical protein